MASLGVRRFGCHRKVTTCFSGPSKLDQAIFFELLEPPFNRSLWLTGLSDQLSCFESWLGLNQWQQRHELCVYSATYSATYRVKHRHGHAALGVGKRGERLNHFFLKTAFEFNPLTFAVLDGLQQRGRASKDGTSVIARRYDAAIHGLPRCARNDGWGARHDGLGNQGAALLSTGFSVRALKHQRNWVRRA